MWLAPQYPWLIWVFISWGVAVTTHALALLLAQDAARQTRIHQPEGAQFHCHLLAYVAETVLILFFVNLTVTPKVWWFYWVALGWGGGVVAHGWCACFKRRPRSPAPPQARKTGDEVGAAEGARAARAKRKLALGVSVFDGRLGSSTRSLCSAPDTGSAEGSSNPKAAPAVGRLVSGVLVRDLAVLGRSPRSPTWGRPLCVHSAPDAGQNR